MFKVNNEDTRKMPMILLLTLHMYDKVTEMNNKNIGTEQNGNRQVLLAILESTQFLGKMYHYFIFNIMNYAATSCLLLWIAVLKDLKMILVKLLIDLMAFNIPRPTYRKHYYRWWYIKWEKAT